MKVLIIGNLGYIGPVVTKFLREKYSDALISGFDIGFFSHVLSARGFSPDIYLSKQYFGDVRRFPNEILKSYEIIVYLAAISNDHMGNLFEKPTYDINQESAVNIAKAAYQSGVQKFVFASSCSVYGSADDKPRTENSKLNPLTAYAKSKVNTEKELKPLASDEFIITCLRFATACGFSPRLRLDLVLNDFVASAIAKGYIEILSDGSPWRPLIHVRDMARAIDWASLRDEADGGKFLTINAGSNKWNYQIKDLAKAVKDVIGNIDISINQKAMPDNRSYQVDFSKYLKLSEEYYPQTSLKSAVEDLYQNLIENKLTDSNFRNSHFMRLKVLQDHIKNKRMNKNLEWIL